ncbi:alpha/beta fold hydrolase [Brevibacillus fulvus]|uniref:Pimeloyl-ACP methyl ester carboxylesterase n=1 Tax=Brevibacillus fulvus TaxID=1125967 RepID=A0A938XWS3_9BACL|nr:alpha/beta fold hydrolase [Brevibacillus fulvus]MBM7589115.1 pimeloyl-ACP methyl ester carboxylesterase [Brevibacillus fulvus]
MSILSVKEEFIDVGGSKVHLYRSGNGEPLLWLHGANGPQWGACMDTLASSYEVIVPDHPGFGQSELPGWMDKIDDIAFHYRDLLDKLGIERAYICGSSLGGWIGLQFALTHAHRVKKLVVSNAAGINIPGKDSLNTFHLPIQQVVEKCYYDKSLVPKLPSIEQLPVEVFKNRAMFARLTWEQGYDAKLLHRLQGLRVPTLIVWGRNDELIPVEHGGKLQQAIPDSRLLIIEQCGHLPYMEKTKEFTEMLFNFLR